ncbi:YbjN domain-containing protein [Jatrophihabitans sp. DSM 45814]
MAAAAGAAARAAVEHRRDGGASDRGGSIDPGVEHRSRRKADQAAEPHHEEIDRRRLIGLAIGRREGPTVLPGTAVLQRILADYGLRSIIDDDGDLAVRWENFSVYFFHYGQDQEVLQARLYLNRRFDVELRPTLALVLDDWNRSKLFPKAYTVLPDDGLVGVCAEQAFDFEGGTSHEQLKFTVGMWLQNLQQFAEWIEEHV